MKRESFSPTEVLIELIKDHIGVPKLGCEIGVWKAKNACLLLKEFTGLHLLLVDRYKVYDEEEKKHSRVCGRVNQNDMYRILKNSISRTRKISTPSIFMISDSTLPIDIIENEQFDYVFIDANHTYETVSKDLLNWIPKVRLGGLVCGHDYGGGRNKRGFFGVTKAVNDYALKHGIKIKESPACIWSFVK